MITFIEYIKKSNPEYASSLVQAQTKYENSLPSLGDFLEELGIVAESSDLSKIKANSTPEYVAQVLNVSINKVRELELKAERKYQTFEKMLYEKNLIDIQKLNGIFDEYVSDYEDWLEENDITPKPEQILKSHEDERMSAELEFCQKAKKVIEESKALGSNPQPLIDEYISLVSQSKISEIPTKLRELSFQGSDLESIGKMEAEFSELLGGARFTKAVISGSVLTEVLELFAFIQSKEQIAAKEFERLADLTENVVNVIRGLTNGLSKGELEWKLVEREEFAVLLNSFFEKSESFMNA